MIKNLRGMEGQSALTVVGAQWGDEGKGKVIDFLASRADVVARYQGGDNAGHTVVYGANVFKLHHVPSGILYPGTLCLLGSGMVVNPLVLAEELKELEKRAISTDSLRISPGAHLVMAYHQAVDEALEKLRSSGRIGTTGRGIGPAYADKALRRGIRAGDLVSPNRLQRSLEEFLPLNNRILRELYDHPGYEIEPLMAQYGPACEKLGPLLADTAGLLDDALLSEKRVLFEGAQGALLDLDHGTYPYVTSSTTTAAAAAAGTGVAPRRTGPVLGVMKAYTTRVGEGPFPSEEEGEAGSQLRERGREYGTTTGRPRRCGWFDAVAARYAGRLNGFSSLAVTKLDILSGLESLRVVVAYRHGRDKLRNLPQDLETLRQCRPLYETFPGWDEDISQARRLSELPGAARRFLEAVEEETGVAVDLVSVGPDRSQTIVRPGSYLASWIDDSK